MRLVWLAAIWLAPLAAEGRVAACAGGRVAEFTVRLPAGQRGRVLAAADFVLSAGRTRLTICDVTHDRQPASIGMILDISGSMRVSAAAYGYAREALRELVAEADPRDEFFVEYAGDVPEERAGFTADRERLRGLLEDTAPKGLTAITDAIYLALARMRKAHHAVRALMVVSDAYDNQSVYRPEELARAFGGTPMPLFLIVPRAAGREPRVAFEEMGSREVLEHLARRTGGMVITVASKNDVAHAMEQLRTAWAPYRVRYAVPDSWSGTVSPDLQVKVKGRGNAEVSYWGADRED